MIFKIMKNLMIQKSNQEYEIDGKDNERSEEEFVMATEDSNEDDDEIFFGTTMH